MGIFFLKLEGMCSFFFFFFFFLKFACRGNCKTKCCGIVEIFCFILFCFLRKRTKRSNRKES
jgi:hypothetical protein